MTVEYRTRLWSLRRWRWMEDVYYPPNTAAFTCLRSLPIFRCSLLILAIGSPGTYNKSILSLASCKHVSAWIRISRLVAWPGSQMVQANLQKKNIVCSTLQYSISVYLSIYSIYTSFQTYINIQKRLFLPAFPTLFNLFPLCLNRAFRLSRTVPTSRMFCLNGTILLKGWHDASWASFGPPKHL